MNRTPARFDFTWYVSTRGQDDWSGRSPEPPRAGQDGPVASLNRVLQLAREARAREPGIPIRIAMAPGEHILETPLQLTAADSGTAAAPTLIAAHEGGEVVLQAGRTVIGWTRADTPPAGAPAAARDRLWVVPVEPNVYFSSLFLGERRLPRSTTMSDLHWRDWPRLRLGAAAGEFVLDSGALPTDDPCASAELNCLPTPYTYWANALTRVLGVEPKTGGIRVVPLKLIRPEVLKSFPWRLENVASGLLQPGQWFLDAPAGRLYLWPPDGVDPNAAHIMAPRLTHAVSLTGEPGDGPPLRHVELRGLTVMGAGIRYPTVEAAPQSGLAPSGAALEIEHVEDCVLARCRFRQLDGTAIEAGIKVRRLTIRECTIAECGGGAIAFRGGPKDPEAPSGEHTIEDNHIHHIGQLYWHCPAISLHLSEQSVVSRNYLHDLPYTGITSGGLRHRHFANWPFPWPELAALWRKHAGDAAPTLEGVKPLVPGGNVIEYNVVCDTMQVLEDGSAIYCHAGHHNMVRLNLICRVGAHGIGLYFDDEELDSTMERNIVWYGAPGQPARGIAIHLNDNARNTIRHNLVVGSHHPFNFNQSYGGHRIEGNLFLLGDRPAAPTTPAPLLGAWDGRRDPTWSAGPSVMDHNLFWSPAGAQAAQAFLDGWRQSGFDRASVVADPGLTDIAHGDFAPRPDSPAGALGFAPPTWNELGPRWMTLEPTRILTPDRPRTP